MIPTVKSLFGNSHLTPACGAMVLTMTLLVSHSASADNGWWDSTGSGNWSDTANWWTTAAGPTNVVAVPTTGQTATFNGTGINGNLIVYLDGARTASSLTFDNTGTTTLLGGISGSPASNTLTLGASGITVNSGVGAVMIGGTGASVPITLGAAQIWTNNGSGTLLIDGNVSNGTNNLSVTGAGNTTISGTLGTGAGTLTKAGTGTLTLSGLSATAASNYSGTTVIDQGILAINTSSPTLTGGLTFGATAGSANIGTLDLSNASGTFNGNLVVQTNSATANTITIGSGKTLTTNGNVTVGANTGQGVVTKLNVTGADGTWNVVKSGGSFQLSAATSTNYDAPTLDMSGLGTFSANLGTTGTMRLGTQSGSGGDAGKATVILAANATITANLLGIGDTGGSATNYTFRLGSGTNTLNVNTLSVGQTSNSRGWGALNFNTSTGSLKIRAADGTGRANLNLRVTTGATNAANITHTFDVSGHSADLLFDTVNLMDMQQVTNAANVQTSVFKFDTGTLDANALKIGTRSGTNANGTTHPAATVTIGDGINNYTNTATLGAVTMATNSNTGAGSGITGTLNIAGSNTTVNISSLTIASYSAASGTSAAAGTVNISGGTVTNNGGIILASRTGAGTGTVSGTLNLTGGSLTVGGAITTVGTVTSNLTLNGGMLDMGGFAIGGVGQLITSTFASGTLKNLSEFNNGATLTKTTEGTLVLDGTNNYSGPTLISGGALQLGNGGTTGSLSTSSAITNNANFTINLSNAVVQGTDFSGSDITGSGSFTQAGAGTTTLNTTNSYTGTTTVSGGRLSISSTGTINNTSGVSIGAGDFNYNNSTTALSQGITFSGSNGTLSGTGTITPAVTITSGNRQTSGSSVTATHATASLGKQVFSTGITYSSGSIFEWNLDSTTVGTRGTNFDAVNTASLGGSSAIFRVILNGSENFGATFWDTDQTWVGIFKNIAESSTYDMSGIFSSFEYQNSAGTVVGVTNTQGSFTFVNSGQDLKWTAVPEPTSALAGLLITAGLLRRRR